jgi:hypothetical protein
VDRRLRYTEKDWCETHVEYVQRWETREKRPFTAGLPHDQHTFDEYLR